jgi:hypothetical protein
MCDGRRFVMAARNTYIVAGKENRRMRAAGPLQLPKLDAYACDGRRFGFATALVPAGQVCREPLVRFCFLAGHFLNLAVLLFSCALLLCSTALHFVFSAGLSLWSYGQRDTWLSGFALLSVLPLAQSFLV